ncbi:MAG: hypothetical protein K5854_03695 [Prevotella sp.]|nr:hypothetical protein [Prevotella sp.]
MIDFFYIIHYVVYRFYRRHGQDFGMSMFYACGLHLLLSFIMIEEFDYFVSLLLDLPLHINKTIGWVYIIIWAIFEYMLFYRKDRYKEIFNEYVRQSDVPAMKSKFKTAKIFNSCLLALDIFMLIMVDYCNHHK